MPQDIFVSVMLVGKAGVGKTSLWHRRYKKPFLDQCKRTLGVDFVTMKKEGITLQLWDTPGYEQKFSDFSSFTENVDTFILCVSCNDEDFKSSIEEFIKKINANRATKLSSKPLKFVVAVTKSDNLPEDFDREAHTQKIVTAFNGVSGTEDFQITIRDVHFCSTKNDDACKPVFEAAVDKGLTALRDNKRALSSRDSTTLSVDKRLDPRKPKDLLKLCNKLSRWRRFKVFGLGALLFPIWYGKIFGIVSLPSLKKVCSRLVKAIENSKNPEKCAEGTAVYKISSALFFTRSADEDYHGMLTQYGLNGEKVKDHVYNSSNDTTQPMLGNA